MVGSSRRWLEMVGKCLKVVGGSWRWWEVWEMVGSVGDGESTSTLFSILLPAAEESPAFPNNKAGQASLPTKPTQSILLY
jgi:hypothetical protein